MNPARPAETTAPPAAGTAGLPMWGLLALATAAFTDVTTDLLPAGLLPQMSGALRVPEARIGLLVTAFSSSYPLTFLARLLAGAMGGTLWSMLAGYAVRMVPAGRRGRAIAIVLAGITVALCLGIPAGTALAATFGWRTSFALLAALALLLAAWARWKVPSFPGEPAAERASLGRVASQPGIRIVLVVTLLLLAGHQAMYTYIAPFAERSGFGHTSLVLFTFSAMLTLSLDAHNPAVLLTAVALWGTAFGGTPTLLQTALVGASHTAHADVATSMQTTVYNVGIAAGSLVGGLILENIGVAGLPWAAFLLITVALVIVVAARRHAFPASRPSEETDTANTAKGTNMVTRLPPSSRKFGGGQP